MPLSMSQIAIPTFLQGLKGLSAVLAKADAQAQAKGIADAAYLQARLYPDMLPMSKQVQIASDFSKGAVARLAGVEGPVYEDNEATFAELKARVDKTIAFIQGVDPAKLDGSEDREVTLMRRGETILVKGQPYLMEQALPNFWFHVTTAYGLLRHQGVEVGKRDFLAMS
jgi:hypothetical protein